MMIKNIDAITANAYKANFSSKMENIALPGKNATNAEYKKVAEEFEAVFLGNMLNHLFENVKFNTMVEDKITEQVYKSMLVNEYANSMTERGGIGIADNVMQQLMKIQNIN